MSPNSVSILTAREEVPSAYLVKVEPRAPAKSTPCKHPLALLYLREILLREGVLKVMISTNRAQNIEALLEYTIGEIVKEACKQCAASLKPFVNYIIIYGFFQKSYSGYHYNYSKKGYSFGTSSIKYNLNQLNV